MKTGYNQANGMKCSTLALDIALCEAVGFDVMELRLDMLWAHLESRSLEELKRRFADSPLRPFALNGLESHIPLYFKERKSKDDACLAEFKRACKTASALGVEDIIVLPPMGQGGYTMPYPRPWHEVLPNCVETIALMADIAAVEGRYVCLEPVGAPKSGVRTVEQAREVLDGAGRPNTGMVPDAANLYMYHKLNDFSALAALPPNMVRVAHINDFDDVEEARFDRRFRCFCGRGVIDLSGYLSALKATGYQGVVSVETLRPEYWARDPRWVVETAWETTRACLRANHCLGSG